jgi:hypothetical protein
MKFSFTWVLILWLALLQSMAPLLHAHVHGLSSPGKVHMPNLEIDTEHMSTESGMYQMKTTPVDEEDAIGMESADKNDWDISVTDVLLLVAVILLAMLPVQRLLQKNSPRLLCAIPSLPYALPWSLAPPALYA